MASSSGASGPHGLGSRVSSVASTKEAASAKAGSIGATGAIRLIDRRLLQFHGLGALGAFGAEHDLLQARFRALQLFFAMGFEGGAALVKRDRILQVHFALLEPRNDILKLGQGRFE